MYMMGVHKEVGVHDGVHKEVGVHDGGSQGSGCT